MIVSRPLGGNSSIDHSRFSFRADGDDLVAHDDILEVRRDPSGALRVTAFDTDELGGVTDGGYLTLTGDPATATVDASGALSIARGALTERLDLRDDGLEQSWDVASAPTGGDLVIRVGVGDVQLIAQTATGLHFKSAFGLGFAYGNGLWIDANGTNVDVVPSFEDGHIVLRVPRAVLDASAYPARLDPTIVAEKAVDNPISNTPSGAQSFSGGTAAASPTQLLSCWQDLRLDGGDVMCTRLSATLAIGDQTGIKVAVGAGVQSNPVVGFVNGQYLVVWEDHQTGDLAAARVNPADGSVTPVAIATTVDNDTHPQLVVRGNQALVVYQTNVGNVKGLLYSSSNTFGPAFDIATTADTEKDPTVAVDPVGNYLVAFTRSVATSPTTVELDVRGQLVSPAGALVGGAFDISVGPGQEQTPTASFVGGNFVVVWAYGKNGAFLYGARVTTAGAVLDTHIEAGGVTEGGKALSTVRTQQMPALTCTTANCLLAWRDFRTYSTTFYDVYEQVLAPDLSALAAETVVAGGAAYQSVPHVATTGASYFVSWNDNRDGNGYEAFGARVAPTGTDLDPLGVLLARNLNREITPAVGRSASTWLVTWGDTRVAGQNVLATRVSNAGNANDSPAFNVSNAPAFQGTPAVATNTADTNYMVVWTDNRTLAAKDIFAARVPESGLTIDSAGVSVTSGTNDQVAPDIIGDDAGHYLVVWQDRRNGPVSQFDIYGALLDHTGTVIATDIPICTVGLDQAAPRVGYDKVNKQYLVVWTDHRGGPGASDIYGARLDATGAVLDTNGAPIAASAAGELDVDLAFGVDRYLVVFRSGVDLHAVRVQGGAAITVMDAPDLVISAAAGKQSHPRVAYLNNTDSDFAVVWADERTLGATGSDIFGTLVKRSTGALDGAEFVVSNAAESETAPSMSRDIRINGSNVDVLVAYQKLDTSVANQRVELRRVSIPTTSVVLVSIAVTPADITLAKGLTQQYTATGTFSDGSQQNLTSTVTWGSSTSAATITGAGLAKAVAEGTTTITADQAGVTGSTTLTVAAPNLVSIDVEPTDPSIAKGTSQQFIATGTFTDGSTVDITSSVTWASSKTTFATITPGGLATGVGVGTTTITAKQGAITGATTLTITDAVVTAITVTPVDPTAAKGTTLQFTAIADFSDGTQQDVSTTATWSTSKASVATVSTTGLATAVAVGDADITAAFGGQSDSSTLTVTSAALIAIAIAPLNASIAKGTQLQYTATGTFSDGSTADVTTSVTWSTGSGAVATINGAGVATGAGVGTTTVKATSGVVSSPPTNLTVTNAALQSITVAPTAITAPKGFKVQFTATGHFSDGTTQDLTKQATWSSSSTTVATVSNANANKGFATVRATSGTASIRATFGGKIGAGTLTASSATLTSIVVTPNPLTLAVGQQHQMTATGHFSDGSTLDVTVQAAWSSSKKKDVSVTGKGLATAKKKGTVTLTASLKGVAGTATVTVP